MPTEPPSTPNARSAAVESTDTTGVKRDVRAFHSDVVAGAKAISPVLPAGATVGLVTGASAIEAGLSPLETIAMSIVVYYPAMMLTAFEVLESGTPSLIATLTASIVGVRSVMLSLSIAPSSAGSRRDGSGSSPTSSGPRLRAVYRAVRRRPEDEQTRLLAGRGDAPLGDRPDRSDSRHRRRG